MSESNASDQHETVALPPVVGEQEWEAALAELRVREKAATA